MPWVEFTDDFLWTPIPVQSTMFKKGMIRLVTTPCSLEAIKLGAAKKVKRPPDANKNSKLRSIE